MNINTSNPKKSKTIKARAKDVIDNNLTGGNIILDDSMSPENDALKLIDQLELAGYDCKSGQNSNDDTYVNFYKKLE